VREHPVTRPNESCRQVCNRVELSECNDPGHLRDR
jgi:hypothetical protein